MKLGKNRFQDKIEIIINLMKSIFLVTNNGVAVCAGPASMTLKFFDLSKSLW